MVGERIRYFRKLNRLSQKQLSEGVCSVSHLSNIENGGYERPSVYIIEELCKKLNISLDDLDAYDMVASISKKISLWHKYMRNRDKTQATKLFESINEDISQTYDPDVLIKFKIFTLNYKILLRKVVEAGELIHELQQHRENMKDEHEYYYLLFCGYYMYVKEDYTEAMELLLEAKNKLDKLSFDDPDIYYALALVYMHLNGAIYSIDHAEQALQLYVNEFNYVRSVECEILLGINKTNMHNYNQAHIHLTKAYDAAKLLNSVELVGNIYYYFGYLNLMKNEYELAIDDFNKCLEHHIPELYERDVRMYYFLAKANYELNQMSEANRWVKKGYELAVTKQLKEFIIHCKVLQLQIDEQSPACIEHFIKNEVLPYFEQRQYWYYVATYAELLANNYAKQFKYKYSSHYYSFVNETRKKIYSSIS